MLSSSSSLICSRLNFRIATYCSKRSSKSVNLFTAYSFINNWSSSRWMTEMTFSNSLHCLQPFFTALLFFSSIPIRSIFFSIPVLMSLKFNSKELSSSISSKNGRNLSNGFSSPYGNLVDSSNSMFWEGWNPSIAGNSGAYERDVD